MMARGQGSGAMVVAGVTPSKASAPTRRHSAGTRISMAAKREPSTGWTCTASGHVERHAGADHEVQLVVEVEGDPPPEQVFRDDAEARAAGRDGIDHDAHGSTVSEPGPQALGVAAVLIAWRRHRGSKLTAPQTFTWYDDGDRTRSRSGRRRRPSG